MRFSWTMGPSGIAVGTGLVEVLVLLVMVDDPGVFVDVFAVTISALMVAAAGDNVIRFARTEFAIAAFALFLVTLIVFASVVAVGARYDRRPWEGELVGVQYILMFVSSGPSVIAGRFMRAATAV